MNHLLPENDLPYATYKGRVVISGSKDNNGKVGEVPRPEWTR